MSKRAERVAERIRAELMTMLLRGAVADPAARGVFISGVEVTRDMSQARIYIRVAEVERTNFAQREAAVQAMKRSASRLRKELAPRLHMKYLPLLKFFWDEGADRAARVEALLEEIREDDERSR